MGARSTRRESITSRSTTLPAAPPAPAPRPPLLPGAGRDQREETQALLPCPDRVELIRRVDGALPDLESSCAILPLEGAGSGGHHHRHRRWAPVRGYDLAGKE